MKITEFHQKAKDNLNFDLVDDTCVFMKNDPMFYRKQYYPSIATIADMHREGSNKDPKKVLMPMIEKGINEYCRKYGIANMPDDIYRNEDRTAIFDKIYKEEMEQIQKGEYK